MNEIPTIPQVMALMQQTKNRCEAARNLIDAAIKTADRETQKTLALAKAALDEVIR